jgi:hypothetical protein
MAIKELPNGEIGILLQGHEFFFPTKAHYILFWYNYLREVGDRLIAQLLKNPTAMKLNDGNILDKQKNVIRLMTDKTHLDEPYQYKIFFELLKKNRQLRGLPINA